MAGNSVFESIRKKSEGFFGHSHHGKDHAERVYNLAVKIGKEENADLDVLKAAALLHDIARTMEDEGKVEDHAVEGAKIARKILEETGFPAQKVEEVVYCVEAHRFRKGSEAGSLEAKILQDADRLDATGAIGLARVFARGGWANLPMHDPSIPPKGEYDGRSLTSINHLYEKILKAKEAMNTRTAKSIAEGRHKFVEEFLGRFLKEWNGEL
ncbi:MAG: HD domain-containing protein [Candidatus Brockarchaeota archaeon]|nr:HD domain-containing protein [Candidatus Brockarchaeota archaeon]